MQSKWQWLVKQLTRTLWVRALLFSLLAIASALLSVLLDPFIPEGLADVIGADAVDHILDILAGSMLAVTTFSLTVMVSAYSAATSSVTPRATRLLMQDTTSQNVLSTFLGSFLFSLVGIVALSAGVYGPRGRVILFVVSLVVIGLVVLALLRWISHLTHFGRVGDTTERVETATANALDYWRRCPAMGGQILRDPQSTIPAHARPIYPDGVAYVEHLDIGQLNECAEKFNCNVYVDAVAGAFVHPRTPLLWVDSSSGSGLTEAMRAAYTLAPERSFDQDPRFGLCVLAEIASRALSPAVNDPGTAIDVLGRGVRVLTQYLAPLSSPENIAYPRVWVPPLAFEDMLNDFFMPISRDGAGMLEVQVRVQKSLHALFCNAPPSVRGGLRTHARVALERAESALTLPSEKQALLQLHQRLFE